MLKPFQYNNDKCLLNSFFTISYARLEQHVSGTVASFRKAFKEKAPNPTTGVASAKLQVLDIGPDLRSHKGVNGQPRKHQMGSPDGWRHEPIQTYLD